MTFGITYDDHDVLSAYLNSSSTSGLAAALSGSFQASPSFEISAATDPRAGAAVAGTGLSRARNLDVGALSYEQAMNYVPPSGPMIKNALSGLPDALPVHLLMLAALGFGYLGYKRMGPAGAIAGALAVLGAQQLLKVLVAESAPPAK